MFQLGDRINSNKESFDMQRNTPRVFTLAAAFVAAVTIAVPQAAANDDVTPPPVPSNLQVPAGQRAFLIGHAQGTQNYTCLPSGSGFTWAFFGPQATLFDNENEQLTTHYLSPNPALNGALRATWQHSRDTSTVWAAAIASSIDPNFVAPDAIPWLLLQVVGAQHGPAGDKLTQTTFIQRVNTVGGIAPAAGCSEAAHVGQKAMVPYTTDYVFYRK
jgi:hypothetical protein